MKRFASIVLLAGVSLRVSSMEAVNGPRPLVQYAIPRGCLPERKFTQGERGGEMTDKRVQAGVAPAGWTNYSKKGRL